MDLYPGCPALYCFSFYLCHCHGFNRPSAGPVWPAGGYHYWWIPGWNRFHPQCLPTQSPGYYPDVGCFVGLGGGLLFCFCYSRCNKMVSPRAQRLCYGNRGFWHGVFRLYYGPPGPSPPFSAGTPANISPDRDSPVGRSTPPGTVGRKPSFW